MQTPDPNQTIKLLPSFILNKQICDPYQTSKHLTQNQTSKPNKQTLYVFIQ